MKEIDLVPLGPRELPDGESVHFGLYLPQIENNRFAVVVRIIHEEDQFIQDIPPRNFPLTQAQVHPEYGAFWETTVLIGSPTGTPQDHWGSKGRYVYRYQVTDRISGKVVDWVIDPFAREYGIGKMSAFTLGYTPHDWSPKEQTWKTPRLHDLVAYEMHLEHRT